jgi:hypothetical protein
MVRLLLWPAHLQIDYSPKEIVASTGMGPHELLGLALLAATIVAIVAARRRAPGVSFGLLWCAVSLFPVSNIVPTSIVLAERTLFLPSVGIVIAVCCAAALLAQAFAWNPKVALRALAAACSVLVLLGVGRSAARHRDWRNAAHIWIVSGHDAPRSLRVQRAGPRQPPTSPRNSTSSSPGRRNRGASTTSSACCFARWRRIRRRRRSFGSVSSSEAHQPDAARELAETLLEEGHYADAKVVVSDQIAAGDSVSRS